MFGLKSPIIDTKTSVFISHANVRKAIIYGSRAKGNYRFNSDIDLVLFGSNLNQKELLRIETELDDLLLIYTIDVSICQYIENQSLKKNINRIGKEFYNAKEVIGVY